MTIPAKDLTKQPPRSPRQRLGGYVMLARTIDKCRAELAGRIGEYHYNCPLDQQLFAFKGVDADAFKEAVASGLTDEQLLEWLNRHGIQRSPEEIKPWSDALERASLFDLPEKREFFSEECRKLGLDPATTTNFTWLEVDDRALATRAS
jgi:hypothetical protein